eukprot:snap_masked-scaffold_23-processed-gene-5.32-mRNA-1 protein AED:0.30 eAED:0.30 QI:0/0/0/0.5/1/1/2/0/283
MVSEKLETYFCKHCRTPLFHENHLTTHQKGSHNFSYRRIRKSADSSSPKHCNSLFIDGNELPNWLYESLQEDEETNNIDSKISCLKCGKKLGNYNWSGGQCSCGTWISPAFNVPFSKVDVKEISWKKVEKLSKLSTKRESVLFEEDHNVDQDISGTNNDEGMKSLKEIFLEKAYSLKKKHENIISLYLKPEQNKYCSLTTPKGVEVTNLEEISARLNKSKMNLESVSEVIVQELCMKLEEMKKLPVSFCTKVELKFKSGKILEEIWWNLDQEKIVNLIRTRIQ